MAISAIHANDITLSQTLDLLDGPFVAMANAIGRQQFALWVGSGISRAKAPDLKALLAAVIEHLRVRTSSKDESDKWWNALVQVLRDIGGLSDADMGAIDTSQPIASWPNHDMLLGALVNKYADVLDVRIPGEREDYLLWDAIDVRAQYGHLDDPDAEHLCIALLIMEGVISEIASANWDGLIELAVDQMALKGRGGILQAIIDPADIRDVPGICTLVKFHGCAVSCVLDPDAFRPFLVAAQNQITTWRHDHPAVAVAVEKIALRRALVAGLSLQDQNLQAIFADARSKLPWPWPCAPDAQGHVFCEDTLSPKQDAVLKVVYKGAYNDNFADIRESALLRAWGKQALLSIAIQVLVIKFDALLRLQLDHVYAQSDIDILARGLVLLRNLGASIAPTDLNKYADFVKGAIVTASRTMSVFRRGTLYPATSLTYDPISPLPIQSMLTDPNVASSGLGWMAVAIALLGTLLEDGIKINLPATADLGDGVLGLLGNWTDAKPFKVFLVHGAHEAVALIEAGALDGIRIVVIHADDTWVRLYSGTIATRRSPSTASVSKDVKHISISTLVSENADFAALRRRFKEEVTI